MTRLGNVFCVSLLALAACAEASDGPGREEFGLTSRELVAKVDKVEALIGQCMRDQGFEYVAVDYETIRRGIAADKTLPGSDEEEFIALYGFGMSTLYTGKPPQLAADYSPAKISLGKRNIRIFSSLSAADQVAYNRALLGESNSATFAVALDAENLSRCGGCTREAIDQVFESAQRSTSFVNPRDARISQDPRMKAALRKYAAQIRERGFEYSHPDEVEVDVQARLDAISAGGSIPLEELSPDALAALKKLQDYERRVAVVNFELEEELIDEVEERIEKEMFARKVD